MKRFTTRFLIVFIVTLISVLSSFSASAEELVLVNEKTADIDIDVDWYWNSDFSLSSDYNLLSNEEYFLFYDQLNENNKAAYDVMKAWLEPRTDTLTIVLPEPVSFQTDSLDMSSWSEEQSEEFGKVVAACVKDGKTALILDYPELFWFDENNIKLSIGYSTSYNIRKKTYTMKINKVYVTANLYDIYENIETAADYISYLKESINNLEVKGGDYYTKVRFIHDYIAKTVTYNMDSPYRNTALGVFKEPYEVVCEGYSEAVKLLCDKENIPCISVIGNVNEANKSAHMWNYVRMEDGKWYGLDCTWDDLDKSDEPIKYQYFLTGASSFLANHIPDNIYITPNFTYPELSENDYVYNLNESPVTTPAVSTSLNSTTITTSKTTVSESTKISSSSTSVTLTTETINPVVKGDFNENGFIDIGDVVMLRKKLIRLDRIKISDYQFELNDDKVINVFDYIILRRLLLKI